MGPEDPYDALAHLGGSGGMLFLKTGTLENAFPGILGHEAQTSEE